MGTNVFNSGTMAAAVAAALGSNTTTTMANGLGAGTFGIGLNRHHHHSSLINGGSMLFHPTPVAAPSSTSTPNSPTAFPFPPPSPLFLPSLSLLQQHQQPSPSSHQTITNNSNNGLPPWMSTIIGKSFASDDNNNELTSTSSSSNSTSPNSPSLKLKYANTNDLDHHQHVRNYHVAKNSLFEYDNSKMKECKSSIEASANRSSPTKATIISTDANVKTKDWIESSEPYSSNKSNSSPLNSRTSMSKHPDSKLTDAGHPLYAKSPYLLQSPPSSSSSPTFGIRPSPQASPQGPSFGSHNPHGHYGHYLLPPSLYHHPYYAHHHQQQQQQQPTPFSPTISPFIVPSLPQSASPTISTSLNCHQLPSSAIPSTTTTNNSISSSNIYNEIYSRKSEPIESDNQPTLKGNTVIDLTSSTNNVVDCTKKCISSKNVSNESSLKRKNSTEEETLVECGRTTISTSPTIESGGQTIGSKTTSTTTSSMSRKHRILKPPNINITESDLYQRNTFGTFLQSPLFGMHPSGGSLATNSPYTYLDHIPLSAPPIPQSKFDFSTPVDSFGPPPFRPSSSSKDLSTNHHKKSEMPNSIMKDYKRKSVNSESKVTFQIPNHHSKTNHSENQENRLKLSSNKCNNKLNRSTNNGTSKSCQKLPDYFRRGSTIKLGNGLLKNVEELSTEDFIESASANGKFKVELSEIHSIQERSNRTMARISFMVGQTRVKVSLDSPIEHPFFVFQKGWSSCSPSVTSKRYGLSCNRLVKGDIVVTLANKSPSPTPITGSTKSFCSQSLASSSSSLLSSSSNSSLSSSCSSLSKCPPPAHLAQSSHNKAINLHSSVNENQALNLDTKSNTERFRNRAHESPLSFSSRSMSREVDDDEEIDVERVDDEIRLTNSSTTL
ncbi:Ataxin 1 [Blomia tropicalis]|nr:Ataxin 1 [Blomia tropicalis]